MFVDFVLNGQGYGEVGQGLSSVRFDPGLLRPYFDERGRRCVTINTGRTRFNEKGVVVPVYQTVLIDNLERAGIHSPVFNATALRKDEWVEFDRAVIKAARLRLRAWADLAAANTFGGFNGMAKLTLEYEAMSDPGEAIVDMDGITQGRNDQPLFKLRSIPLPITHSDFWFSARRLAVSRGNGTPLDTNMAEAAGRRVAEMVEKTTIGVETGVQYGPLGANQPDLRYDNTSKVYGYTNLPQRITKTNLVTPTGTNPSATIADVISMRETMYAHGFFGPFFIYYTPAWDQFLDMDYILTGGNIATQTLRQRIESIEGISGFRRLDFWTGATYQMIMVQMAPEVCRAIDAMAITTVQWESQGGMRLNFKVMCIQVPQFLYDFNGVAAIIHATTS